MNYDEFNLRIQTLAGTATNNTDMDLRNMMPALIEYGELRIYRDMDFLATLASQTATLAASSRNVALPTNVIVLQAANLITPVAITDPDLGTRRPLTRVSLDFLNTVWPSATPSGTPSYPQFYAEIGLPTITSTLITAGAIRIVVGPAPDAAYTLECIGTVRPTVLSAQNATTFLSTNMPDLFIAACMKFVSDYQQNPEMAGSWEQEYNLLKTGVNIEEMRKKAQSTQWTPQTPAPIANAPRERSSGAAV